MTALLDINVLIALAWPSHMHHDAAHDWFRDNAAYGWATCPLTENGFVRVSSNRRIVGDAVTPREAIRVLDGMAAHPGHRFWPDSLSLRNAAHVDPLMLLGHRQVTDAYLLSLAIANEGALATFDRGILQLVTHGSLAESRIVVIPG